MIETTSLKRLSLFPRSLRQLVTLSFVLILLPLLVLAWQAWQSLNALSAQAAHINRTTLVDARRSEAMINAALEMERSYRQYCVLDDPTLARVYQNQRQRYSQMLDAHAGVLPDEKLWQALRQDVSDLAQLQCKNSGPDAQAAARLEVFASNNSDMVQATRAVVYSRGQQLQQEIAERGQFFGWQALVLFLLSLALVLLFTRMIIGPVKGIERMINQLGAGKSLDDAALFTGPRELRSVGKRIIWLSERLAWLESQRHQFLRHLSHELKTPLTSMKVLADSLVGQEGVPEELYQEFMSDITAEIDRENKIITDLLSLVKLDKKAADLNVEHLNINQLLEDILKRLRPIADKRNIDLILDSFRPVEADVDEVKFTLAISNLVENGIKYNVDDGWVRVTLDADHKYFYVKVADSGMGIPEESVGRIFERFYRVDKSHSKEIGGTGLGLAITRSAVTKHHGTIQVESKEGEGTTFTVRIPLSYIP